MWKCKKCRGTTFQEQILGGYQTSFFDKNGDVEEIQDQDLDYGDVSCCNCGNNGDFIQDIADWEEEDERD
ncbi:hypothetical protein KSU02_08895 [Fusobacterium nucleatum]|uniref:hypothetical protein n=1 Tax=Fusobacterium nucleatum TaxID=851 RepID=UPI0030CD3173